MKLNKIFKSNQFNAKFKYIEFKAIFTLGNNVCVEGEKSIRWIYIIFGMCEIVFVYIV